MTKKTVARHQVQNVDVDLSDAPPEIAPAQAFPLTERAQLRNRLRGGQQVRTAQALPEAPGVNALTMVLRYLPGGRDAFIEYIKLAALNKGEAAMAFWQVWSDLSNRNKSMANFDDILFATGYKPSDILKEMVGHGVEANVDTANLVASMFQPAVVEAMGRSAMRIDGPHAEIAAEDRKLFLQGRGMLPIPKGATTHVHVQANAQAASASASEPSVPKFADDLRDLKAIPATIVPDE